MRREEAARAGERLAALEGVQPAHQAELRRLQAELGALFTAYLQRRGARWFAGLGLGAAACRPSWARCSLHICSVMALGGCKVSGQAAPPAGRAGRAVHRVPAAAWPLLD